MNFKPSNPACSSPSSLALMKHDSVSVSQCQSVVNNLSRRTLLNRFTTGLGGIALAELLSRPTQASVVQDHILNGTHFAPKAKRIIYLFMSGGPSQIDLFDHKPLLNKRHGEQLPDSVRGGQRLTGMSGNRFVDSDGGLAVQVWSIRTGGRDDGDLSRAHGVGGVGGEVDVHGEHESAAGRDVFRRVRYRVSRGFGSWLSYGLGQENSNLPSFVVMITKGKGGQPLGAHLWGSGFLPTKHGGVQFRAAKDPVLYLGNPEGISADSRRLMLDRLRELHEHQFEGTPDVEISNRMDHYEMAFRMQSSIPEATDFSNEPQHVLDLYDPM